jgi:hypothetical protein
MCNVINVLYLIFIFLNSNSDAVLEAKEEQFPYFNAITWNKQE